MAELGAEVIAIDASKYQMELANKINAHRNVIYGVGCESDLQGFENDSFDLILINMVFPSLNGAKEAEKIIKEFSRVIKPKGKLIISILHPLFLHPIQSINDRATDFKFYNYFNEGHNYTAEAITTKNRKIFFRETHFSLEFISKLLESNGFCIRKIRESRLIPEVHCYVPVYLAFECILESNL